MVDIREHGGSFGGGKKMVGEWEEHSATASTAIPKNSAVYVSTSTSHTQTVTSNWNTISQNYGWYDMCVKVKIADDKYFVITGSPDNFGMRTAEIITMDSNGYPTVISSLELRIYARIYSVTRLTDTRVFIMYSKSTPNSTNEGYSMILDFKNDKLTVMLNQPFSPYYGSIKNATLLKYNNSQRGVIVLAIGSRDIGYSDTVSLFYVDVEFGSTFAGYKVLGGTKVSSNVSTSYLYLLDCFVTPTNDLVFAFHTEMYVFSQIDGQTLSMLTHTQPVNINRTTAGLHVETIGEYRVLITETGFVTLHYDAKTNLWVYTEINSVDDLKADYAYDYRQSIPYATFRSGEFYGVNEHNNWVTQLEQGVYILSAIRYYSANNFFHTLVSTFCLNMGTLKKGTFSTGSTKYGTNLQSSHSFYNRNNGILTVIGNEYDNNTRRPRSVGIQVGVDVSHTAHKASMNDVFIGVAKHDAGSGSELKFLKLKI